MMHFQKSSEVIHYFETVVKQFAQDFCAVDDWLSNDGDNVVKSMEIEHAIDNLHNGIVFIKKEHTGKPFTVEIGIDETIDDWGLFRESVYHIITRVAEPFLLIQMTVEEGYFFDWYFY